MADFSQQAGVVVGKQVAVGGALPVIATLYSLTGGQTPIALPIPNLYASIVNWNLAAGASIALVAAVPAKRPYIHSFMLRSSAAVRCSLEHGGNVYFNWTFVAAEIKQVDFNPCAFMTNVDNTDLVIFNRGGVATNVDGQIWYALQ